MTRYPGLWLTAAFLTAAALVVAWATKPARRLYRSSDIDMSGGVPAMPMLPRVPQGFEMRS